MHLRIFLLTVALTISATLSTSASAQMKRGLNVLGTELRVCSTSPLTGYMRDGFCSLGASDFGKHGVCAEVTEEFLTYTKKRGNDLSTPAPHYNFPGLKPGDRWCLCVSRWKEAADAGVAPKVVLSATDEKVLKWVELEELKEHAIAEGGDAEAKQGEEGGAKEDM
uniref:DUF2237 domain-containing protein n=1 Tax=Palpitomonas bilix TaxID=652834 RepID=A0A7S3DFG8_9EUKA|mmetsp:Transcript_34966/g.90590  ORF Transcript_34966/g.90590 Transcript_34966/m.90590 type:complete len:166 (+) Transcript_34966:67-564(+)